MIGDLPVAGFVAPFVDGCRLLLGRDELFDFFLYLAAELWIMIDVPHDGSQDCSQDEQDLFHDQCFKMFYRPSPTWHAAHRQIRYIPGFD